MEKELIRWADRRRPRKTPSGNRPPIRGRRQRWSSPGFSASSADSRTQRGRQVGVRMSLVRESYCATRTLSSLHTEAPTEPLRERPDQSEARRATAGVLQIEAEPLVLHTELVESRASAQADRDGNLPM